MKSTKEIAEMFHGIYDDSDSVDEPCIVFYKREDTLACISYLLQNRYEFVVSTNDNEDAGIVLI